MVDTVSPVDWRELREFFGVDLSQSFILSWHLESETLMIDVDLHLTEDHPFYEKPRPAEKICIRPAIVEFPFCEGVSIGDTPARPYSQIKSSLWHGVIKGLRRHENGRYEIYSESSTVFVSAERPLLRLKRN